MARDYKHRVQHSTNVGARRSQHRSHPQTNTKVNSWKWVLISALVITFAVFLSHLRTIGTQQNAPQPLIATQTLLDTAKAKQEKQQVSDEKHNLIVEAKKHRQYEFYDILAKQKVVVQKHEIKSHATAH
jgi:hypothetical protein